LFHQEIKDGFDLSKGIYAPLTALEDISERFIFCMTGIVISIVSLSLHICWKFQTANSKRARLAAGFPFLFLFPRSYRNSKMAIPIKIYSRRFSTSTTNSSTTTSLAA